MPYVSREAFRPLCIKRGIGNAAVTVQDAQMSEEKPEDVAADHGSKPVEEMLRRLHETIETATAGAVAAVRGGDVDQIFDAGMRMGVTIAVGLATAHAIKERKLRDERRAAGQGELYKRHDYQAQAFEQLAKELMLWSINHTSSRDS